jgi:hypothetical protein
MNYLSLLPVLSSLPVEEFDFIPMNKIGLFISEHPFKLYLKDQELSRTFMLALHIRKNYIANDDLSMTSSRGGEMFLTLKSPVQRELFSTVKMFKKTWNARIPYKKRTSIFKKLPGLAFTPSHALCTMQLKAGQPPMEEQGMRPHSPPTEWSSSRALCMTASSALTR